MSRPEVFAKQGSVRPRPIGLSGGSPDLRAIWQSAAWLLATLVIAASAYFYLLPYPMNHDNAWLMEATRRWLQGAELYRDVIEINPPLIFIENIILSAGMLTKASYLAGVCASIAISSLWVARANGPQIGFWAAAALISSGLSDFGQRDHLALIFLVPLLLNYNQGQSRYERLALGLWAFLGIGLKPHFALIPLVFAILQCINARSIRAFVQVEFLALGGACVAWLAAVGLIWPQYFTSIVITGTFVYSAYGTILASQYLWVTAAITAVVTLVAVRDRKNLPLAGSAAAALVVFYAQGKFWHYHFIPALGLAAISAFVSARRQSGLTQIVLDVAGAALLVFGLAHGPRTYPKMGLPSGLSTVLFLSDRVGAAYPATVECGIRNVSRYPAYWILPGAWNRMTDPRDGPKATSLFIQQIAVANREVAEGRPQLILEDIYHPRFKRHFQYSDWIDLSDYKSVATHGRHRWWIRKDLADMPLDGPACS